MMYISRSTYDTLPETLKLNNAGAPIGFIMQGGIMTTRFVVGENPRKLMAALANAAAQLLPAINIRIDGGFSPNDQPEHKKLKALAAGAIRILNENSTLFSKSRPRTTIDILASWRIYAAQHHRVSGKIGWYDRGYYSACGFKISYEYHPAYYDTLDQFVLTYPANDGTQQVKTHTMRRETVNTHGSIVDAARSLLTPEMLPAEQQQLKLRAGAA